jgi:LPS export ABC transporter protein LptC
VRRLRIAFGVSLLCVLTLLVGLAVHGYRRAAGLPAEPGAPDPGSVPQASLTLNEFRVTETAGDATRWDLHAARGEYFESRQRTLLEDVEVTFYTRDGRTLTLRGDAGELSTATKDISLTGNVVATSSDGYRVTTGALDYTNDDRTVRGNGPVVLVSQAIEASGVGVAIQVEEQTVSIPGGVASVLRPTEPGRPVEAPARAGDRHRSALTRPRGGI